MGQVEGIETLKKLSFRLATSVFIALLAIGPVCAQEITPPQQVNPGLVVPEPTEDPTPYGIEKERPAPVELELPEQPTTGLEDETIRFEVQHIELEGNTVFSDEVLEPFVQPYEGRKVTLKELSQLTEAIAERYRNAGYMTTQVYLPPQSIENGVVRIAIVEGSIGKVVITGNKYYKARIIRDQLDFEPGELLNIEDLEANLNNVNRNQPYRLKAVLSRGEETGETDINLDVLETQPWQVTATFDNQGRPFIGMFRYGVEVSNESLLGYGDRLSLRYLGANGTQVGAASYNIPVHRSGTTVGYGYSFGYVNVDLDRRSQPTIEGFAHNHSLTLSQPLNRSRSLMWDGAMNFREISTLVSGDKVSGDSIRSLSTGISYNRYDAWGRTFARLQTDFGLKWMGGNREFWKTNAYLTRLVVLPKNNLVILRGSAQMTPHDVPSAEAFQIGGAYSVRGFTEGLLIGDRGYNFGVEWRWPIPGLRHVSPWLGERLQGVLFYDIGQVFVDNNDPNYSRENWNDKDRNLLHAAGTGLRFRLTQYLSGFVDFGFGITRLFRVEPNGQPTMRVHFGVQSELLPKEYKVQSDQKTVISRIQRTGGEITAPPEVVPGD